jgi:hypothetical protein
VSSTAGRHRKLSTSRWERRRWHELLSHRRSRSPASHPLPLLFVFLPTPALPPRRHEEVPEDEVRGAPFPPQRQQLRRVRAPQSQLSPPSMGSTPTSSSLASGGLYLACFAVGGLRFASPTSAGSASPCALSGPGSVSRACVVAGKLHWAHNRCGRAPPRMPLSSFTSHTHVPPRGCARPCATP